MKKEETHRSEIELIISTAALEVSGGLAVINHHVFIEHIL